MDHSVSGSTFIIAIFAAFAFGIVIGLFMGRARASKAVGSSTGGGAHAPTGPKRLPAVAKHSPAPSSTVAYTDDLPPEVLACIPNKKIEAIKLYREATGLGLKEAKDRIDAAWRQAGH